jgi:hypothetical protein
MNQSQRQAREQAIMSAVKAERMSEAQLADRNAADIALAAVTEQPGFTAVLAEAARVKKSLTTTCCSSVDAIEIARAQGGIQALDTIFARFVDAKERRKKSVVVQP